jgi:hypothetical protein
MHWQERRMWGLVDDVSQIYFKNGLKPIFFSIIFSNLTLLYFITIPTG